MSTTISTVTVSRLTSIPVAVGHPSEWTPEQVAAAVAERQIDIGMAAASMWCGETRTTLGAIAYGEDTREEADGMMGGMMSEPIDIGPEESDGE